MANTPNRVRLHAARILVEVKERRYAEAELRAAAAETLAVFTRASANDAHSSLQAARHELAELQGVSA